MGATRRRDGNHQTLFKYFIRRPTISKQNFCEIHPTVFVIYPSSIFRRPALLGELKNKKCWSNAASRLEVHWLLFVHVFFPSIKLALSPCHPQLPVFLPPAVALNGESQLHKRPHEPQEWRAAATAAAAGTTQPRDICYCLSACVTYQ